jgi:hypothetical protein
VAPELALVDLHRPFARLRHLAVAEATAGRALDAFLLAAAATQVLDDHLHPSKSWPKRLHDQLDAGTPARRVVRVGLDVAGTARATPPGHRRRIAAREVLHDLDVELAAWALGAPPAPDLPERLALAFADDGPWNDELDATVLVLPSGLRSFDQHPRDLVALAARVAAAHPDRRQPQRVVGVRTSGSYLGPLLAAALRAEGYVDVGYGGVRPDDHLDSAQRATAREGLVLLVDDPPVSGDSLAESADLLLAAGAERVVVALALDDPSGTVPPALQGREVVLLPADAWHLPTLLAPERVRSTLQELLDAEVGELTPVPWPGPEAPVALSTAHRDHRRAAFLVDGRTLLVESTGQGFFGRHNLAVAEALAGRVPEPIGFVDGLFFQWLSVPAVAEVDADEVVDHLRARHRALAVERDPSEGFEGRQCVAEVATELLAGNLGPLTTPARLRIVNRAVERVLRTTHPSVVDGRVTLDRFLGTVKLDAAEGAFSHRDLATYDPAFDVAQLAETPLGPAVRTGWGPIEPERWLLHRLVHNWDRRRHRQVTGDEARRVTARALEDHLAETVLAVDRPADGPWVALDVDGVVEGPVLGASAPGRTGAMALRALLAHGHRIALVTGRSVADVEDRVRAWGLAAGVAEYGTAVIRGGRVDDLRSDDDRRAVERLRGQLGELVYPGHTHAVRTTRPLSDDELTALDLDGLVVVPGEGQTDFVPAGCGKRSGFEALGESDLALAVGDGPADLDLLDLARRGVLPAHARDLARAGHHVAPHPYQAGLADAVGDLIGHPPGGCPTCAVHLTPETDFVLAVLSLKEAGPRGIPSRLARVLATARRAGKPEEGARPRS